VGRARAVIASAASWWTTLTGIRYSGPFGPSTSAASSFPDLMRLRIVWGCTPTAWEASTIVYVSAGDDSESVTADEGTADAAADPALGASIDRAAEGVADPTTEGGSLTAMPPRTSSPGRSCAQALDVAPTLGILCNNGLLLRRPPRRGVGTMTARSEPTEHFTTGQVARLTGVSFRQLDHWAWTGFLPPSGGDGPYTPGNSGHRQARHYTFGDLVRIRTVGELRRQGVPLQVIRQALDRLQQVAGDPLRELTLVAIANEVYVCRSREDVERATDGQLAFTVLDVGAMLRRLRGQIAALRTDGAASNETTPLAVAG